MKWRLERIVLLIGAMVLAGVANAQQSLIYENPKFGLAFSYPSSWKVKISKKGEAAFAIPTGGGARLAKLQIWDVATRVSPESWQAVQEQINKQLKKTVIRQWDEEILGVPLLMHKLEEQTSNGQKEYVLGGMFYNRAPFKMVFRLTALEADFEEAEFEWRKVLESIRTLDGKVPEREDPAKPPVVAVKTTGGKATTIPDAEIKKPIKPIVLGSSGKGSAGHKDLAAIELKIAGEAVLLMHPKTWAAKLEGTDKVVLTHPSGAMVAVSILSELDSGPPLKSFRAATRKQLELFEVVARSDSQDDVANSVGSQVSWLWRIGKRGSDEKLLLAAIGVTKSNYWMLTWEGKGDSSTPLRNATLHSLVQNMTLVPKP